MIEKKLMTLTIDPEFRDLIPPLTGEELKMLEDSIVRYGCEQPLVAWNGVLVDGHNRYSICQKHEIPFAVEEKHFEDRNDAMMWMLRNQLGRRNLNSYQRSELVLKYEPFLRAEARNRQSTSTGGDSPQLTQNSAEAGEKGETRMQLGKLAGVSHDTIKKVKKGMAAEIELAERIGIPVRRHDLKGRVMRDE